MTAVADLAGTDVRPRLWESTGESGVRASTEVALEAMVWAVSCQVYNDAHSQKTFYLYTQGNDLLI